MFRLSPVYTVYSAVYSVLGAQDNSEDFPSSPVSRPVRVNVIGHL